MAIKDYDYALLFGMFTWPNWQPSWKLELNSLFNAWGGGR